MNNSKEIERLNYELQKCLIEEVILLLEESEEKYKNILEGEVNEYNG